MKKIFLVSFVLLCSVSVSFGDCVDACMTKAKGDCLVNNCKKWKGHPTKYLSCVNECTAETNNATNNKYKLCKKKCEQ